MASLMTASTVFEISPFAVTVGEYQDHILFSESSSVDSFFKLKLVKPIIISTKHFILYLPISLPLEHVWPSISSIANTYSYYI